MQEILKKQRTRSKRLWALLLCVVLLLGIMPTTAFAASDSVTSAISGRTFIQSSYSNDFIPNNGDGTYSKGTITLNSGSAVTDAATPTVWPSHSNFTTPDSYYNVIVTTVPHNQDVVKVDVSGTGSQLNVKFTPLKKGNVTVKVDLTFEYTTTGIFAGTNADGNMYLQYNVTSNVDPAPTTATMEIPISKTVELGTGSVAPEATDFNFEVEPYGNPQADISGLTITGTKISTDGAGNYTGTLKIVGDPDVIDNARGLKITEKNDGAANWTYDDAEYIVYRDTGNGMVIQKDMGPNMNTQTVRTAEFTNTFTKDPTPPGPTSVTMEIPISKQVVQNGKNAPGAQTFAFEVAPYGNPQADISGLTITGATIATNGDGTFTGTLKIVGDPDVIDNARGLKITEKDDGAAHWIYDIRSCVVYRDTGSGMLIQRDRGTALETVQTAVFYNTYKDNTMTVEIPYSKTISQTGSIAPGAATFEFEVKPKDPNADMSGITITGTTIDTNGEGTYTGTITIVGDAETIEDVGDFTITEKNVGAANWTYDDTAYIVGIRIYWPDGIPDLGPLLFAKDMGPNTIPQEVQSITFTNSYAYSAPVSTEVAIEIPISKTVKLGGNTAPGAKTFEFEVKPYGNSQADISRLEITGASIATNGAGNYTGTLKIVGPEDVINNARGFTITEKNDGAANWSYDTTTYIVYPDYGNGIIIQKDMGANMNPQPVQRAEFTNTYTKNSGTTTDPTKPGQDTNKDDSSQTTSPKTGDNSNMLLWIALMAASLGGIVAIGFVKRKRAHSK